MGLAALNLRYNPFGELDRDDRGRVAVVDVEPLVAALRVPGTAVQLRGACGRGKSTHLHAIARALPEARYSRVDRGGPRCSGGIYLMDEADHFGSVRRWAYLRRASSLAVATHADMSRFLRLCGYRVVDVAVGGVRRERLVSLCDKRIEAARAGEGPVPSVPEALLAKLEARHGDDLRAIEDALYDWVQDLAASS